MKIQLNTILLILLLVAIIALLGQRSCISSLEHKLAEKCPEGVITTDTTKVKDSSSTGSYIPQPTMAGDFIEGGNIAKAQKEQSYRPTPKGRDLEFVQEDGGISKAGDFSYSGSFHPGPFFYSDTVKNKYGKIIINDTTEGPILSRRVLTDFDLPVVTRTNTITLKEPARVRGYLSFTAQGNKKDPLQAAGGGFMLQFKNYDAVELDALYNLRPLYPGQPSWTYQVSYKPLISFRKK